VRQKLLLALVTLMCLGVFGTSPPIYAGLGSSVDAKFNMAMFVVGSIGFSTMAYYMYKNSPAQHSKSYEESLGLGEWYVGAYTGLSYLPAADWNFFQYPPPYQGRTAKNVVYQPGVLGGVKFGRYFDSLPWFGLEVETNFSRNAIRGQNVTISPPLPDGKSSFFYGSDWFMIWDMQFNLLARCGFLKDKEVPFGRLQPYIGIGPGFEIIYGRTDSAKNFAFETLAGLRYMCTKNIGLFCEYKFSYQFKVEYEKVLIDKQQPEGMMRFDVPHHRFTLGVSYHFKNLFGN
jgi:opacity protein-like surface antigen